MLKTTVLSNKAQCALCGDVIESTSRHDFKSCKCGEIFVDGGLEYLRRGASDLRNIIEMTVTIREEYEYKGLNTY